ncbi:putative phosphomannomutase [Violaceomyces palustris]|uniref:Phosphomannomutase n=1 Tax=Violaceomyces palustris TaxID=1673888 RepID=A0ACD0P2H0_9BASI|nr:putative phosphomannomutase [Violaceomyces palustris]
MSAPAPIPTDFSSRTHPRILCLFDVDGTLSPARGDASKEMIDLLARLRQTCAIGVVGGSDLKKIREQFHVNGGGRDGVTLFDYFFAENGLTAFKFGKPLATQSFINWLGEEKYQRLAKFCLRYISQLDIPVMRGTFIEFRNGMINVSPIGRNASTEERHAFEKYDKEHGIRPKFIAALKEEFPDYGLTFSIGGQISFDVFPHGWDKTYSLRFVTGEDSTNEPQWDEIHFFGDKTYKGGNDYEIFSDPRTIGHTVTSPEDTARQLEELFFSS